MSKNHPESSNLYRAIKEVSPEEADKLIGKYESLVADLSGVLLSPEKNEAAEQAKVSIDDLAKKIIDFSVSPETSDSIYFSERKNLVEDFGRQIDDISDFIGVDLADHSVESAEKDLLSASDLKAKLDAILEKKDSFSNNELKEELGLIFQGVMSVEMTSPTELPGNGSFYVSLVELTKESLKGADADTMSASKIVLAKLRQFQAMAERAYYFSPGRALWEEIPDKSVSTEKYMREDRTVDSSTPLESGDVPTKSLVGVIEKTDFYNARLKLENEDTWHDFSEFETYGFFIGSEKSPQFEAEIGPGASPDTYVMGVDVRNSFEPEYQKSVAAYVTELVKSVDIPKSHIQKNVNLMLSPYVVSGAIELAENGWVLSGNALSVDDLKVIEKAFVRQMQAEEIYDIKDSMGLVPQEYASSDPYFESRKLFLDAQISLMGGDEKETYSKFRNFLDATNKVSAKSDSGIAEGVKHALGVLKLIAIKNLTTMKDVAVKLFMTDEGSLDFVTAATSMVDEEIARIQSSDSYKINFENLRLKYWSDDDVKKYLGDTRGTLLFAEADEYAAKKAGWTGPLPEAGSKKNHATISGAPVRDGVAKFRDDQVAKMEEYRRGYLEDHYPSALSLKLWNRALSFKQAQVESGFTASSSGRKELFSLGDALRNESLSGGYYFRPEGVNGEGKIEDSDDATFASVERVLYEDELRDEIISEKALLQDTRGELLERHSKKRREEYLKDAKSKIKSELMLQTLVSNFSFLKPVQLKKAKTDLLSNPEILDKLAGAFVDARLNSEVEDQLTDVVFDWKFKKGSLSGKPDLQAIWSKMEHSVKFQEKFESDQKLKELIKGAMILAASVGVAGVLAQLSELAAMTWGGAKVVSFVEGGNLGYRALSYGNFTTWMTAADKSIRSAFLGQDTWGNFGHDWLHNYAMISAVGIGEAAWNRVLGNEIKALAARAAAKAKRLVAEGADFAGAKAFGEEAKSLGYMATNLAGSLGTETSIFTAFSVANKLALMDLQLGDVDFEKEFISSFQELMVFKAAGKVFGGAFKPALEGIQVKKLRLIENNDPTGNLFLGNNGLSESFFDGLKTPEARKAAVETYRASVDQHGVAPGMFTGKTAEEIAKTVSRVESLERRAEKLTGDDLVKLLNSDPLAFDIFAGKSHELPFSGPQVQELLKTHSEILFKYADKLPRGPRAILGFAAKKGVEFSPDTATFTVENSFTFFRLFSILKSGGFKLGHSAEGEMIANVDGFNISVKATPALKESLGRFYSELTIEAKSLSDMLRMYALNPSPELRTKLVLTASSIYMLLSTTGCADILKEGLSGGAEVVSHAIYLIGRIVVYAVVPAMIWGGSLFSQNVRSSLTQAVSQLGNMGAKGAIKKLDKEIQSTTFNPELVRNLNTLELSIKPIFRSLRKQLGFSRKVRGWKGDKTEEHDGILKTQPELRVAVDAIEEATLEILDMNKTGVINENRLITLVDVIKVNYAKIASTPEVKLSPIALPFTLHALTVVVGEIILFSLTNSMGDEDEKEVPSGSTAIPVGIGLSSSDVVPVGGTTPPVAPGPSFNAAPKSGTAPSVVDDDLDEPSAAPLGGTGGTYDEAENAPEAKKTFTKEIEDAIRSLDEKYVEIKTEYTDEMVKEVRVKAAKIPSSVLEGFYKQYLDDPENVSLFTLIYSYE